MWDILIGSTECNDWRRKRFALRRGGLTFIPLIGWLLLFLDLYLSKLEIQGMLGHIHLSSSAATWSLVCWRSDLSCSESFSTFPLFLHSARV
jgi:hypothetical protein